MALVEVVAGVIERQGHILICQRRAGDRYALQWEFPGGKVEPGESPEFALARELREELNIQAEIGREIERYRFEYAGGNTILLVFFEVPSFQGEPQNMIFADIRWEPPENLPQFDFLANDRDFVARLARGR